jgi:hypothetical protein
VGTSGVVNNRPNGDVYRGKFLLREDLLKYSSDGVITIESGVRVTALAIDAARDLNITIQIL